MKKKKTVIYDQCDFCDSGEECWMKCLRCGKSVCYKCRKTKGVEYAHAVSVSGAGDGFYCHECDAQDISDLHAAYVSIARLRQECQTYYEDFRVRQEAAEKRLKSIQKAIEKDLSP